MWVGFWMICEVEDDLSVVGDVVDGVDVVVLVVCFCFDVVFMDICMFVFDGVEVCVWVVMVYLEIWVLMFIMFDLDDYVFFVL